MINMSMLDKRKQIFVSGDLFTRFKRIDFAVVVCQIVVSGE